MNITQFPKKLKAVLFDMDGILYDSMKNHSNTWLESFKKWGIDFPLYDSYMNEGRTGESTIRLAFLEHLNREPTPKEIKDLYDYKTKLMLEAPEAEILPRMQGVVADTMNAGIKAVVVTGSRQPILLERLQSDYNISSGDIISGFDVKHGKPHPEPYLLGLEKAGCSADEAVVIENAPMGVESAVAAKVFTIGINTGILKPEELSSRGANLVFNDTISFADKWQEILKGI